MARLQLAAAPEVAQADEGLVPVLAFDFAAVLADGDEPRGEGFRPHTSLVEQSPAAVPAWELLKRARAELHGSISFGIDSKGGWDTRLELYKEVFPNLSLGIGISVGRYERWGWD